MKKRRSSRGGAPLGQHFLTGQWAAATLAKCIDVRTNETILEIGPGNGALTKELLKTGARVLAVEKDSALAQSLINNIGFTKPYSNNLRVIEGDIRDFDPSLYGLVASPYVVAANIPYYITGEIIRKFLTASNQPRAMALLVQKEVAERIVARKGKESILSISVKAYGHPKIIAKVSRGNFSPSPSVDSAILLISDISRAFFTDIREEDFFKIVRAGFASKRKLLAGNLMNNIGFTKPYIIRALGTCEIPEKTRAEDVSLDKWKCLTQKLTENSKQ